MVESAPKVPRLVPGVDVRALPLAPIDGFVLSRIDGTVTVYELAEITGLAPDETTQILEKLVDLGAAEWSEATTPRISRPASQQTPRSSIPRMQIPTPAHSLVRTAPPPPGTPRALYDPAELEEDVELDFERRRAILDTYYRLEEITFYELLGVPRASDKKEIRSAYFELSKQFHPDTLFRKRLGSYKAKMEAVFNKLTEAYEVLGKKQSRQEYDAYIALRDDTFATQQALIEAEAEASAIERQVSSAIESAIVTPSRLREPEPATPPPEPEPVRPPEPEITSSAPTEEGRRRAQELLARKLAAATGRRYTPGAPMPRATDGGSRPPSPQPPVPAEPPKLEREQLLRGLASSLKQAAAATGGADKATRHVADARKAEAEGNLLAAANSMRLALALAGERPDLAAEYERIKSALGASLADSYEKQAAYEMRNQKWSAAAISWSKVAEGRPHDSNAARHTAECLLHAAGDLHKAQRYARKAVDLGDKDAKNRRVLAQVYMAAGLRLNAKRELEAAAKLDPQDEIVKNLLRELKD